MKFSHHLTVPPKDGTITGLDHDTPWSLVASHDSSFLPHIWDPDMITCRQALWCNDSMSAIVVLLDLFSIPFLPLANEIQIWDSREQSLR